MGLGDCLIEMSLWLLPRGLRVRAVQTGLNKQFGRYGIMTELKIDNTNKTISAVLMLDGETQPIVVQVAKYDLAASGELRFSGVSVSRAWMDLLAQEYLANKPFQIPPDKAKLLAMIL